MEVYRGIGGRRGDFAPPPTEDLQRAKKHIQNQTHVVDDLEFFVLGEAGVAVLLNAGRIRVQRLVGAELAARRPSCGRPGRVQPPALRGEWTHGHIPPLRLGERGERRVKA